MLYVTLLLCSFNIIESFNNINGINNRVDHGYNNQQLGSIVGGNSDTKRGVGSIVGGNSDTKREVASFESDYEPVEFLNSQATASHRIGQKLEYSPVLVLNADYTPLSFMPLSLWTWQDALRAVFNEKATVISEYNIVIKSPRVELKVPSVVALKKFQKSPESIATMNRRNVFIRDGYKCQYCLEEFPNKYLSLDHVIPRCKGGKLTWTNTVTACYTCNGKKGHTLPEDLPKLGMRLRTQPKTPTFYEIQFKARMMKKATTNLHPHWTDYVL